MRPLTYFARGLAVLSLTVALPLACGGETDGDDDGIVDPDDPFGEDPFGDEQVCAEVNINVNGVTPTVSLLIDQSGSMNDGFGGTDRWNAVYDTLMRPGGVVERLETQVRFGLSLYTSFDGNAGGAQCPVIASVAPSLNNFQAINAVYDPADPESDTPTGESIDAVAAELAAFQEPGPKIIVLGTDGEPDTCAVPDPQNGQELAVQAAQRTFDKGIRTFVISVGDDVGEDHLQDMANAGVGNDLNGPDNEPFYVALNPEDLVDAFEQIIGGVTGCIFTLEGEVDPSREGDGKVALDGKILEPGVDWDLLDGKTIEILGDACDTIQDGDQHDVAAVFPCGAVIVK